MTASSFTSVSLDPLLVLVCAERRPGSTTPSSAVGCWAVSVLPATAQRVGGVVRHQGPPAGGAAGPRAARRGRLTGAALLLGVAVASFECETYGEHDGGDHTIVVGRVMGTAVDDRESGALMYHRGLHRRVVPLD